MSKKDTLYAQPIGKITDFAFDDNVAKVFPDMIQRSVPGYSTIIAMTGVLAERYVQDGTNCYDLGSSLGASTLSMRQQLDDKECTIIAIDNSKAMQERCKLIIEEDKSTTPVELVLADMQQATIENASVVVLNFTLQFIAPDNRKAFLQKVFSGMRSGGILILSEKIRFEDPHLQTLNTDLHHSFKRNNGYSDMEFSQKRAAIENILIPESIPTHERRLNEIGFHNVDVWFQCFNFASLVAIKK